MKTASFPPLFAVLRFISNCAGSGDAASRAVSPLPFTGRGLLASCIVFTLASASLQARADFQGAAAVLARASEKHEAQAAPVKSSKTEQLRAEVQAFKKRVARETPQQAADEWLALL